MLVSEFIQIAIAAPAIVASLTYWDNNILPKLQKKGIMPYRESDLRKERVKRLLAAKTMTPLTCDVLPNKDDVAGCVFIGSHENVRQYVCTDVPTKKFSKYDSVVVNSVEFQEYLGKYCCVEKRFYLSDKVI